MKLESRIVITGIEGFLGKNLLEVYQADNKTIYGISKNKVFYYSGKNLIRQEPCNDLKDVKILPNDIVYHLGWSGTTGKNRSNLEIQLENIRFTSLFYLQCLSAKAKNFVYTGSIFENEIFEKLFFPKKIETPNPAWLYGAAKISTNVVLNSIKSHDLPLSYVRITNIFGNGGSDDRFINFILDGIAKNKKLELSSCEQLYDFVHVSDAISALKLIGELNTIHSYFNLSSGQPRKLKEYLIEIFEHYNVENYQSFFGAIKNTSEPLAEEIFDISELKKLGFVLKKSFIEGINELYSYTYESETN